jgi:4-hydroxy-3-polyprenylbenzoate decarboxylase
MSKMKVLVCITGAIVAIYGVSLIRTLKKMDHEIHLIISKWGQKTLEYEMNLTPEALSKEVDFVYNENNLAAKPASGSFHLDAVIIAPCSMKTLAGIAHGYADNLIGRAADCALKERRKLVLVPRETPLNLIHLRNMATVTEAGGTIFPAAPAFWHKPNSIEELVESITDRILAHIGIKDTPDIEWKDEI